MKIGHLAEKPAVIAPTAGQTTAADPAKSQPATPASAATPAPDASAKVELSSTAATLLSSGASAEFDADKVARITQAIQDGSFKVNPEVIADKLIANAQELVAKSQS